MPYAAFDSLGNLEHRVDCIEQYDVHSRDDWLQNNLESDFRLCAQLLCSLCVPEPQGITCNWPHLSYYPVCSRLQHSIMRKLWHGTAVAGNNVHDQKERRIIPKKRGVATPPF